MYNGGMKRTPPLPNDIEELKALILSQQQELDSLKNERNTLQTVNKYHEAEIYRLQLQLIKLRKLKFGQSSEKTRQKIGQLQLELEDLYVNRGEDLAKLPADLQTELDTLKDEQDKKQADNQRQPKRKPLPEHLPREDHLITPANTACTACGGETRRLGEDVSESLHYVPSKWRVIRQVRVKLACQCCDTIVQEPAAHRPLPRSYASASLLSHVVVGKFVDHLPLHRQCEIFARDGVEIPESTLGDWIGGVHHLLAPLLQALQQSVFSAGKIHCDDTPIAVLMPGTGKTQTARLWAYVKDDRAHHPEAAPAVWFEYSPDRKETHPLKRLADYRGVIQTDAYSGFIKAARSEHIERAGCWAHARRKFYDVHQQAPDDITRHVLEQLQRLYAVEASVRGQSAEVRRQQRQKYTRPLLEALKPWLIEQLSHISVKSNTAQAIGYTLNEWEALTRFLSDGRLEADNNIAERSIRAIALGRRNYLFLGSHRGGERAATMYSLLGSARLCGLNPEAYLRYVLEHIAEHPLRQIADLLPWNVTLPPAWGQSYPLPGDPDADAGS